MWDFLLAFPSPKSSISTWFNGLIFGNGLSSVQHAPLDSPILFMERRYEPVYRMDHYEIGEGGRSDCLPRKAMVCSCGINFSVGAHRPVFGWTYWGGMHWEMAFKDLDREVFSKCTKKRNSSRFWNDLMVFWAFPNQNSTLSRRKLIKNWQTGMRNSFLGKVPHNSTCNLFIFVQHYRLVIKL